MTPSSADRPEASLSPEVLDRARIRLEAERERVRRLITDVAGEVPPTGDHAGGAPETWEPEDVARTLESSEEDQAVLGGLRRELDDIEAALGRVRDGTYGLDEETGEPIDPDRLEAEPTARTNARPTG